MTVMPAICLMRKRCADTSHDISNAKFRGERDASIVAHSAYLALKAQRYRRAQYHQVHLTAMRFVADARRWLFADISRCDAAARQRQAVELAERRSRGLSAILGQPLLSAI